MATVHQVKIEPLTDEGFAPFGQTISAKDRAPAFRSASGTQGWQLPMDKIPNAKRVFAKYRPKEPFGVPIGASQIGIAYNAKKLKTRPTAWADLWSPEYKGRIGLSTPASMLGTVTLLSFARLRGGDEGRFLPAAATTRTRRST